MCTQNLRVSQPTTDCLSGHHTMTYLYIFATLSSASKRHKDRETASAFQVSHASSCWQALNCSRSVSVLVVGQFGLGFGFRLRLPVLNLKD